MCDPSRALALGHAAVRVRLELAANPQLYVRVLEDSDASTALAAFDGVSDGEEDLGERPRVHVAHPPALLESRIRTGIP